MCARYIETEPLDGPSISAIDADVREFVERWHSSSLASTGINPDGSGSVADIEALDYVIYESVYDIVSPAKNGFIALSASVFGSCLKGLLVFDWCRVRLSFASVMGVKHSYNNLVIPLEPIIASHLSGDPQYDNFECLFFKVLRSTRTWPIGSHFLEESTLLLSPGEFDKHWGFSVPGNLSQRYLHLSAMDENYAVSAVGMLAYDWKKVPDWNAVDRRLSEIEYDYVSIYGADWRDRLKARSPQLFV